MFKKDELLLHTTTNSIVKVIKVLPKKILETQQVLCKCIKSSIKEDKHSIFEYDLNSLVKYNV